MPPSVSVLFTAYFHVNEFLSLQICHEFERFSTYMPNVRVANFFGGFPIKQQIEQLKTNTPHAVVGTPGRLKQVNKSLLVKAYHFTLTV